MIRKNWLGAFALVGLCAGGCDIVLGLDKFSEGPGTTSGTGGSTSTTGTGGSAGSTSTSTSTTGTGGGCPGATTDCGGVCADLGADQRNCGKCGTVCSAASPGAEECANGACLACAAGRGDCNGLGSDHCETDVASDQKNCGACGHVCAGACAMGKCQPVVLASMQASPSDIAVDASFVYWSNSGTGAGDGAIMKVPRAGGQAEQVSTSASPFNLAINAFQVFWTSSSDGSVYSANLAGGAATLLKGGQGNPWGIALDATAVYWTAYDDHAVRKIGQSGNQYISVATTQFGAQAIAMDGAFLYWANNVNLLLQRAAPDGSNLTQLYDKSGGQQLALDATHVYFIGNDGMGGSELRRVPKVGGASEKLTVPVVVGGLAVDDAYLYWSEYTSGGLLKISLANGVSTILATGLNSPGELALDGAYVYWIEGTPGGLDGKIKKIEKIP